MYMVLYSTNYELHISQCLSETVIYSDVSGTHIIENVTADVQSDGEKTSQCASSLSCDLFLSSVSEFILAKSFSVMK